MCYNRHDFDSRASPKPSAAVELSPRVGWSRAAGPAAVGGGGRTGKHGGMGQCQHWLSLLEKVMKPHRRNLEDILSHYPLLTSRVPSAVSPQVVA